MKADHPHWFFNIPNILTFSRILMIPIMTIAYYLPVSYGGFLAALIFALASITDWFDGYLARKLEQSTPFGAFLDPVADKLMVVVALILLVESQAAWWFSLAALVIIGREVIVSALREWMASFGERERVAVSFVGKFKTALQMISIIGLLACKTFDSAIFYGLGLILLYIAVLLTLWSMWFYLKSAIASIRVAP